MKYFSYYFVMSIIVIATTLNAQTTFEKWLGGNYDGDVGYKIIPAVDGGYIIAGSWTIDYGQTWDTETDATLIKIDENGNLVWRTNIPTVARYTSADQLKGITTTQDGGYIATGIIQTANDVGKEDVLVAKFTSSGDTVWTRRYDFAAYDCGNSIIQSDDGGYIIVGRSGPLGNDNILFFKINASGDTLWSRKWGDAYVDRLNDVITAGDGNFYAAGCTQKVTSPYTLWDYIIKLSTNGDTLWTKKLVSGEAISIKPAGDGGYIIAEKEALVKVNASFTETWRKSKSYIFGLYGGNIRCAIPVTGGGYMVTGKSDEPSPENNQQLFIAKFAATGDTVWTKRFGVATFNKADEGFWVVETGNGNYLATGFTSINSTTAKDIYLVKVNSSGTVDVVEYNEENNPAHFQLFQNYPNPFNPSTHIQYSLSREGFITLKVFDLLGREVATLVNNIQPAGIHTVKWNAEKNASGIYYYRITNESNTQTMKLILIK